VTGRETAGLSAKGQPIDADAGLPQLVRSGHAVELRRDSRFHCGRPRIINTEQTPRSRSRSGSDGLRRRPRLRQPRNRCNAGLAGASLGCCKFACPRFPGGGEFMRR
jgi:hypothetical protein